MVETNLPTLQLIDGTDPKWIGREIDGHGLLTFDSQGSLVGAEVLGAYGRPIGAQLSNGSLAMNGFQGMERDSAMPVTRMGVRHMANDGRWLQPEPFLIYGGIDQTTPRGWVGVYSGGNPVVHSDRSGLAIETGWDVFNVGVGAASLTYNLSTGNWWGAGEDTLGLIYDVTATAVPGLPAGASAGIKARRAANLVDTAYDASKGVGTTRDAAKVGD